MLEDLFKIFITYWPEIMAAFAGFIVSFFLYLKSRFNYKTQLSTKEIENIQLQKIIAAGSYVVCPECGKKIFLADTKILTGGQRDEIEK